MVNILKHSLLSVILLYQVQANSAENTAIEVGSKYQVQDTLFEYNETISELESKHGVYHPSIREILIELGQVHQQQENYIEAAEAYERALHISKVNEGVHDSVQIEIVELLVNTYSNLGYWSDLEKNMEYMLWLYRRNHSKNDEGLVSMIKRLANWYRQSYEYHSAGKAVSYLVKADDLFDEASKLLTEEYSRTSPALIDILHSSAMTNYQIAFEVEDSFRISHRDIREAMIPNKRPNPYLNEIAVRKYYFEQSFHKGKRSLGKIIESYEAELPSTIFEYAQAIVYQGDYYLSLNRKWNAMKNYTKAYSVLTENESNRLFVEKIFGQVRRVKPFRAGPIKEDENEIVAYADVVFDVPSNGWPKNVRVIRTHPLNNTKLIGRGRHAVSALRYRPRFEAGKAVDSEGISLRYYFEKQ
jgi:tetratricopeptide (TPR) repeat protein